MNEAGARYRTNKREALAHSVSVYLVSNCAAAPCAAAYPLSYLQVSLPAGEEQVVNAQCI